MKPIELDEMPNDIFIQDIKSSHIEYQDKQHFNRFS